MSRPRVVVVGNVGIDTNVFFHGRDINWEQESNFTQNFDYIGQAGGYTARGFAQLDYPTAFVGHVGDDYSGRFIRDTFTRGNIDTSCLFTDPAGTARSVNMMFADGRRKNFYDGKSHMTLQPDLDACAKPSQGARLAHFHLPNWARHLLPLARRAGCIVSCDIQDVISLDEPYRADFISAADILFFSAVNHGDPAPLIRSVIERDPRKIIVSGMGSHGCALGTSGGIRHFPPEPLDSPVVDTNGAGDALAVGFLSAHILDGLPLEAAIRRGQIAARHTCSLRADSDHLIRRHQLPLNA